MPSTYLKLVNKVLVSINEVELSSSDFAAATGIHKKAKEAVNDALKEISSKQNNWPFNATTTTQLLTAGTVEYNFPSDCRLMDWKSFQLDKDDTLNINHKTLKVIERNDWYDLYRDLDDDAGTDGKNIPDFVFKSHGKVYGITPSPNEAYTVSFRYYTTFTDLDMYDDETVIYTDYDHVIHYGALKHMNQFLDNLEQAAYIEKDLFKPALGDMRKELINDDQYMRSTQITRRGVSESGVVI